MNPSQRHACARCRASKLRCFLDTLSEYGKCRRCHSAGTECVFESVAPRQRRKRTDTRVAVLEQQLAGLRSVIGDPQAASALQTDLGAAPSTSRISFAGGTPQQDTCIVNAVNAVNPAHPERGERRVGDDDSPLHQHETIPGLVGADQLPWDVAIGLLDEFVLRVIPEYPVVALPDGYDFGSLRISHPTLLLAMITAASRGSNPILFRNLHSRLIGHLADQIFVQGCRSLEHVQAILVMEVWYDPPDDMARLNFYMWIQVAGIMSRQLALWPGGNLSLHARPRELDERGTQDMSEWRTAFAVFLSNSTVAISLRRPLTLAWTEAMRDKLERFDQTSTHANDRRLVAWVRLQIIAESIEASRLKIPSASNRAAGDEAVAVDQPIVRTLEARLGEWRYANRSVTNSSLQVHFSYCHTKLYELAVLLCRTQIHAVSITASPVPTQDSRSLDMTYIRVLMSLIQSCHSVLDTVLHLDSPAYLRCPTVTTVRALYALQEIYALWKSMHVQPKHLADVISDQTLAPQFYASQIKDFFERAAGGNKFQVPRMALASLATVTNDVLRPLSAEPHQHQQRPVTASDSRARTGESASSTPLNDMDVILEMDITSPGLDTHLSPSTRGLDLVDSDEATEDQIPFQPLSLEAYNLGEFGASANDASMLSEFEMMALPGVTFDPDWFLPEDGYLLEPHRG